jgi:hypothetical protein
MKKTYYIATLFAGLSMAAILPAGAASTTETMRPGLWETTGNLSSSDPQTQAAMSQVQKRLAGMSPAQRQQLQGMLKQHGVQADLDAGGAVRSRVCLTREMIERQAVPVQQGECTQHATPISPTHIKVAFTCTKPAVSGEGDVTVDDPTHYHARVNATTTNGQNVSADATGAWVSADCGSVRPEPLPRAK